MAYYEDLIRDIKSDNEKYSEYGRSHILYLPKGNILIIKDFAVEGNKGNKRKIYTLREVLRAWGVVKHYPRLMMELQQRLRYTEDKIMYLCVEGHNSDLRKEPHIQKLLYFEIRDKHTGNFRSNGGILFENGKMSWHS